MSDPPGEPRARLLVDRVVFLAVLSLPALFLVAHQRMRGRSGSDVTDVARTILIASAVVLIAFTLAGLLRKGHDTMRWMALGGLALAAGGLLALREAVHGAAAVEAISREATGGAAGPIRVLTVAVAAWATWLFMKAGRAGAWSMTFAYAGILLAVDVAILALLA